MLISTSGPTETGSMGVGRVLDYLGAWAVTLENVDIRGVTIWQEMREVGEGLCLQTAEGQRKVFGRRG